MRMRGERPSKNWWNKIAVASYSKSAPDTSHGECEGKTNDERVEHDAEYQNL